METEKYIVLCYQCFLSTLTSIYFTRMTPYLDSTCALQDGGECRGELFHPGF